MANKNIVFQKIKSSFLYLWFIVIVSLLMTGLMWSVYRISVEKIRENTMNSMGTFVPSMISVPYSLDGSGIDTYTDAIMLSNASFLGRNNATLYDAMMNPRMDYSKTPEENLFISLQKVNSSGGTIVDYPRFWHGYLIFIKPLLVFFDLAEIQLLNLFLQVGLLLAVLYLMYKRLGFKYCAAFLPVMCFLNMGTSWVCLEYATDINIMLLATLWVLLNKKENDGWMFFVIGAVTILFDFFTFPLITWGVPLIVYVLLYERGFKENVFCILKNSFLWGCGYVSLWLSKWVIATLLTGKNVFSDGWSSMIHRTWGAWELDYLDVSEMTYGHTLIRNLELMFQTEAIYYVVCFILLISVYCFFHAFKIVKNVKALVLLGIGCVPFVWYGVLLNHSYIHPWMTHKILVISIYAVFSALVCCLKEGKNGK